jgi:hypothetical protein
MKRDNALKLLLNYSDRTVQAAAAVIQEEDTRRKGTLQLIQSALGQLRLDVSYLAFDLQATRRERDELKAELEKKP